MTEFEKIKKELQQKKEGIKRTITKIGLTAFIGLSATSSFAQNSSDKPSNSSDTSSIEISQNTQQSTSDIAIYSKTYELKCGAPIHFPKQLGDGLKAYYLSYLDNGKGGIVVSQYSMSDNEAFLHAKQTHNTKYTNCDEAITNFATRAKNFGYTEEIKTLKNVKDCLTHFSQKEKKKEKLIYNHLCDNAYDNGLSGAITVLENIENINQSNMAEIKHEKCHAENGQFIKKIEEGEVLLSPGGMYLVRMADELRAQILGENIAPTQEGIAQFFQQFGKEYQNKYLRTIDDDISYKRLFAYNLTPQKVQQKQKANVNNSLIPTANSNDTAKDKNGNICWVNALETNEYIVYLQDLNKTEIKDVSFANGKKISLNCLYDKNKNPILDENGNKILATALQEDGDFKISYKTDKLTTHEMDKNLTSALSQILQNTPTDVQNLILESLDKYCNQDAKQIDNNAINAPQIETMHKQTTSEDVSYILSHRKKNLQEQNNQTENLHRINNNTLTLNAQDFNR